ncbi:polysaccharide biosynthesis tyrosine autokinase [Phormidium sp. CLA17]|uniref:GumC family protein n=1 Tax=Leptolyngbya sp. Cla-17 TaxID=2803751 RepID=UPI0014909571|nr:polysaccharide biosynthesis tyrosine autokinase [Leptolyngbya sp. Cla-17]MBM0741084.1 polysaccharide biosynthesis tyrosine autokinase [Leptolyngbya sp. Cla-17]
MQATQTSFNPEIQSEAGYGQIFAILLRRRFWVLGMLVAAIGVAALQTIRQAPTYVSSMQLLIESNYQGKPNLDRDSGLENEFSDANVQVDTATQINVMQSSELLRRAMVLLRSDYPDINPDDPNSVAGFKGTIDITQITQRTGKENVATKIFQIVHNGNDPVETQKALEALKKVYLDYNLEQQKLRLTKGLAFVNEQLPQVKNKMQQAESALKQFRQNQELIDPDLQAKVQTEGLLRVQQEQQTNQVQLRELRSRYTSLQQQLALSSQDAIALSRLSQSIRYQNLLNEIQKTELLLEQQRLRFKDQTPFVQQLKNQRQRQLSLLQTEIRRVLGTSSAISNGNPEQLLSQGQFGNLDQTLVGQLVESQVNLQAAQARERSLATIQQQLRAELVRFPQLLAEYGRLQPEVELSQETLKQLLKAQQDIGLEIARGGFDWQVVEDPQLGAKTGPSLMRNLMLGAVAGLMLGGAAAFARESADDAVHSSDDLKKQVPVPLLGMVPELTIEATDDMPLLSLPFSKSRSLSPGIDRVIQWQPFRESLDLLYQNIQLLGREQPFKSLVITSALAGEGKSTIILGLAISAARLHQRVLLIDADLRRPSLHKLLNLPNDRGLSNLLTSDRPIPQQVDTQDSNLRSNISVVTAGPTPTDPAKLLSSQRMRQVMATFEQNYDLVLLDAPPVLGMVDSMLIGACCNGVIIVGRIERVTRLELTQTTQMLNQLNVIGVVANGASHQTRNDRHYQR